MLSSFDKVKILVLGDSGVGKTSLTHLICYDKVLSNPSWTLGCCVQVKLHEYKVGTSQERNYFVELWDIGGSGAHSNTRSIFYTGCNGIILVHDLLNRKSFLNLSEWAEDAIVKDTGLKYVSVGDYNDAHSDKGKLPLLVIGTRLDQQMGIESLPVINSYSSPLLQGSSTLNLDCMDSKSLAPGTTNAVKLCKFFDKVIQRKFFGQQTNTNSFVSNTPKLATNDESSLFYTDDTSGDYSYLHSSISGSSTKSAISNYEKIRKFRKADGGHLD